ncbi:hypothetical protein ACET3Z_025981 [Daucus carota]
MKRFDYKLFHTARRGAFQACLLCTKIVPHAEKRFRLHVVAYDQTGKLDVIISDREVYEPHRFIGYRARDVIPEGALPAFFPNQVAERVIVQPLCFFMIP